MEELPNLEVSPKPRGNQITEEAGVLVFGGSPNSRGAGKAHGDTLISRDGDGGGPEAVIRAETEHWLAGGQGSLAWQAEMGSLAAGGRA